MTSYQALELMKEMESLAKREDCKEALRYAISHINDVQKLQDELARTRTQLTDKKLAFAKLEHEICDGCIKIKTKKRK